MTRRQSPTPRSIAMATIPTHLLSYGRRYLGNADASPATRGYQALTFRLAPSVGVGQEFGESRDRGPAPLETSFDVSAVLRARQRIRTVPLSSGARVGRCHARGDCTSPFSLTVGTTLPIG